MDLALSLGAAVAAHPDGAECSSCRRDWHAGEDRTMCVFVVLLFFGPRSAIALWWIFDSLRFDVTFSSFWVPFIGFLLAPWTTLMYVLVAPGGVTGFDWVWMGLAVVFDIASYSSGGVYGRRRSVRAE